MSTFLRRINVLHPKPSQKLKESRVRIRRLLFFLVPILLSDTTSLHAALGPAPGCLPPAALRATGETVGVILPISELGPAIPNYDPEERDYLIKTIVFEASGEPESGKAAVAFVILNRERSGRWGDNIEEVVTQPWQFEPWMTRRREIEKLSRDDPRYQSAARIADTVLSGQMEDPTAGATHFLNPVIVRQRRGGSLPSWARGEGQPIGRHTFYWPSEGGAEPEQPVLSMSLLGNPLSCGRMGDQPENSQLETDRVFDQMAIR
jgi:Cell Wall Hydrolase